MFRRDHLETPIDPAPVCWDRRQTVNLVSAGGLVEQSNVEKNNPVGWLAGWLPGCLAGWLAAWLSGCLAVCLAAGWLAACLPWLPGWLAG